MSQPGGWSLQLDCHCRAKLQKETARHNALAWGWKILATILRMDVDIQLLRVWTNHMKVTEKIDKSPQNGHESGWASFTHNVVGQVNLVLNLV